ncbi:MAG: hypothetical protein ACI9F9_003201 [Candidatus Paceibacteria bacterium]|jgi:hypothetical protein
MKVIDQLKTMADERFITIYTSLEHQGFGPMDNEVAKVMKFRPQAIRKVPMDQRAKRAKRILETSANAEMCYEIFGSYLIKDHKELVTSFLDLTGVKHEDGMIHSTEEDQPDGGKIAGAVQELDGKHEKEDVTLYLSLCAEQWPGVKEIQEVWSER